MMWVCFASCKFGVCHFSFRTLQSSLAQNIGLRLGRIVWSCELQNGGSFMKVILNALAIYRECLKIQCWDVQPWVTRTLDGWVGRAWEESLSPHIAMNNQDARSWVRSWAKAPLPAILHGCTTIHCTAWTLPRFRITYPDTFAQRCSAPEVLDHPFNVLSDLTMEVFLTNSEISNAFNNHRALSLDWPTVDVLEIDGTNISNHDTHHPPPPY